MGTYKHIGRLRSARLVGRDVASFYMLQGETQKAAAFLGDLLRTFEEDGWNELAAQTHCELAQCHKKAGDTRKFVKSAISVCAAPEIDTLIRWTYFDDMCRSLDALSKPLTVPFANVVKIVSVTVKNESVIMQDQNIEVEVVLESNFPREVLCSDVLMSLEVDAKENSKVKEKFANCSVVCAKDLKNEDPALQKLKILRYLDFSEDKQLSVASAVVCKSSVLKRKDSLAAPHQSDFSRALQVKKLVSYTFF